MASSDELDLEGHRVELRTIGAADGALATVVHVPELRTLCSGDIAYNNVHMWLWRSTPASREAWLASLDALAGSDTSGELVDAMLTRCPELGNRYTLVVAAATQFASWVAYRGELMSRQRSRDGASPPSRTPAKR